MECVECPICCDQFTLPKLLPCRHSFCLPCLKDLVRKTKIKNQIKCPMCRYVAKIPKGGVSEFFDNYFIAKGTLRESENNDSFHLKGDIEHNLESSFSDDDSDDSDGDVMPPFSLLLLVGRIRTKFKATLLSAFSSGREECVNSVFPISDQECWTIPGGGPDLVLFDVNGQESRRLPVGESFCDLICREDGSILLTLPEKCMVGIVNTYNGEFSQFASTRHCRIGDMSSFADGRVVVVGTETVGEERERRGKIQIFSKDGEYINGLAKNNDDFNPFAVAVNQKLGTFSVVDSSKSCVYTLLQNGDILSIYSGGLRGLFLTVNPFVPRGICYDSDGNLIIVDAGSSTLHVLNSFGEFVGLILTNHEDQFGNPFCVATDHGGKLWIGDGNDGTIRVYKLSNYINQFGDGAD